MEKISFGNKEYVKASQIAKKFRYTQDYVGQLCRNKKVDARLVGRTWYVTPESVTQYRKTKHKTQKSPQKAPVQAKRQQRSAKSVQVHPVVRRSTAKNTGTSPRFASTSDISIHYSSDKASTIPISDPAAVKAKAKSPKPAAIKLAKAKVAEAEPVKLKVSSDKRKKTTFSTEKIPEIALSGKLKLTDDMSISDDLDVSKLPTEKPVAKQAEPQIDAGIAINAVDETTAPDTTSATQSPNGATQTKDKSQSPTAAASTKNTSKNFTPSSVKPTTPATKSARGAILLINALIVVFAFSAGALILATEAQVLTGANGTGSSSVWFDFSHLLTLIP